MNFFFSKRVSLIVSLLFITAGAGALWTGCASKSISESDPKQMYEDAEKDVNNDRYLLALDKLRIVKSKFSYTSYGALAQLKIGDVYFLQESYPEASAAYESFVELYPKNDKAPYALFRAGESYFKDIPAKTERDLRSAESAINAFTMYAKRYPDGEYKARALDMKTQAFNKLAEKELLIAEFYIRRKKRDSARIRLQKILDQYAGSTSTEKAKQLLKDL
jgi:outer membrane protein assembly factor BamD